MIHPPPKKKRSCTNLLSAVNHKANATCRHITCCLLSPKYFVKWLNISCESVTAAYGLQMALSTDNLLH